MTDFDCPNERLFRRKALKNLGKFTPPPSQRTRLPGHMPEMEHPWGPSSVSHLGSVAMCVFTVAGCARSPNLPAIDLPVRQEVHMQISLANSTHYLDLGLLKPQEARPGEREARTPQ